MAKENQSLEYRFIDCFVHQIGTCYLSQRLTYFKISQGPDQVTTLTDNHFHFELGYTEKVSPHELLPQNIILTECLSCNQAFDFQACGLK